MSLISAITNNGILYANTFVGSINATIFIEFMQNLIDVCQNKAILSSCVFIFDNAKIHHAIITKSFIESRNINILYLSPYSYMLNPIEFSFSKIKAIVRRKLGNGYNGSFKDLILDSVNHITREDLENYYRHIINNCGKAVLREDFH
ncbi:hypothetical protein DMUE_0459 [Dictyocoela muelleri]|nr:hypothetical protein DMUE_0459 [Dictyocoela muelleri]